MNLDIIPVFGGGYRSRDQVFLNCHLRINFNVMAFDVRQRNYSTKLTVA